jgi:hypothetical protein
MEILKMLADLRAEREHIEQAMLAVERLAAGIRGKRRGRPPKVDICRQGASPCIIRVRDHAGHQ